MKRSFLSLSILLILFAGGVWGEKKESYGCEYEFNGEMFRFVLQRIDDPEDGEFFFYIQEFKSVEFILLEDESRLVLGNPIMDLYDRGELVYRTLILDKENLEFNVLVAAEPKVEADFGIWSASEGQCEILQ